MFTINRADIGMKIRVKFYQVPHPENESRFDTVCRINYDGLPPFIGVAKLHPNDKPDKIIGKKIALANAMHGRIKLKDNRTVIWKAFLQWVESWKANSKPLIDHQARATQAALSMVNEAMNGE